MDAILRWTPRGVFVLSAELGVPLNRGRFADEADAAKWLESKWPGSKVLGREEVWDAPRPRSRVRP